MCVCVCVCVSASCCHGNATKFSRAGPTGPRCIWDHDCVHRTVVNSWGQFIWKLSKYFAGKTVHVETAHISNHWCIHTNLTFTSKAQPRRAEPSRWTSGNYSNDWWRLTEVWRHTAQPDQCRAPLGHYSLLKDAFVFRHLQGTLWGSPGLHERPYEPALWSKMWTPLQCVGWNSTLTWPLASFLAELSLQLERFYVWRVNSLSKKN